MSVLRPPPISAFIYPEAVPGTPQGKTCRATRCQLSSGVPPSPVQPASKPAAPRLHKTVASTRLCQGRSAGKGLARGGEGRLFSRPCNFPRSRLAGPAGVGRGPGPSQGGAARLRRTEVGSGKVRIQPSAFCFPSFFLFFFFFTPLSFSLPLPLWSWERSGEGGEGRGGDGRHPCSPGLLGSGSSAPQLPDDLAVGPARGRGRSGELEPAPGLSFPVSSPSHGDWPSLLWL